MRQNVRVSMCQPQPVPYVVRHGAGMKARLCPGGTGRMKNQTSKSEALHVKYTRHFR